MLKQFLILPILVAVSLSTQASTYYVDSGNGNDANGGTGDATAWQSLWKAGHIQLQPGDQLLFARGGVWQGKLELKAAGTEANPIYIGAYGDASKPKPRIDGGGKVPAVIMIKNGANYVTVENMAVTNFAGKDIFDGPEGMLAGIQVGTWGDPMSHIKILNNDIFYIQGYSNSPMVGSPQGTTLDKMKHSQYSTGALFINPQVYDDVLLDGNNVHDCTGTGILPFAQHSSTGLVVQNNTVNNVGSDGIEILNSTAPLVQHNTCINAGNNSGARPRQPGELGANGLAVVGMWATGCSDVLFQYNYCEGTHQIKFDGEAWDFDNRLTGTCIYQYNYSRDNEGGFLLSNEDKRPNYKRICRYNISVNDGTKQGNGEGFFNNIADYYNNIFYRTDGKSFFFPDNKMGAKLTGTWENNIFYTTSTDSAPYQTAARTFTNNCFYGFTPKEPGANAVLADPMFADPNTATTSHSMKGLEGFQLKPGSPCLGAGVVIPDNGGKNFWGAPVDEEKANIGAE